MQNTLKPLLILIAISIVLYGCFSLFVDRIDPLLSPPHPLVQLDEYSFELKDASAEWTPKTVRGRGTGYLHGKEATREDIRTTDCDIAVFDFGKYPPQSISATYASSLTAEELPTDMFGFELPLKSGSWIYTITAEWHTDEYEGIAKYSMWIVK